MQTTGTVVLNARGVNINGYDCFVNLSKDEAKKQITSIKTYSQNAPFAGYPDQLTINSTTVKHSVCSIYSSNSWELRFIFPNENFSGGFTAAAWIKKIVFDQSKASNPSYEGQISLYNASSAAISTCGLVGKSPSYQNNKNVIWNGSQTIETSGSYMDQNWHYYALTLSGSTVRWFIDGVLKTTATASSAATSKIQSNSFIGFYDYYSYQYIDDIVLIKDHCLWTSSFTPPSTYLLDSEYAMDLSDVKRRNIMVSNVDKKLIIPDDETLKQY